MAHFWQNYLSTHKCLGVLSAPIELMFTQIKQGMFTFAYFPATFSSIFIYMTHFLGLTCIWVHGFHIIHHIFVNLDHQSKRICFRFGSFAPEREGNAAWYVQSQLKTNIENNGSAQYVYIYVQPYVYKEVYIAYMPWFNIVAGMLTGPTIWRVWQTPWCWSHKSLFFNISRF